MPHANFLVSLKIILLNEKNEVLALEAQMNGPMAGYYDLPGGRIDDNEIQIPFHDILKREIQEEIGNVECTISQQPVSTLSWIWPTGEKLTFIYYTAKITSGEVQISDEHQSYSWVTLSKENIEKYFTTYHKAALTEYISE